MTQSTDFRSKILSGELLVGTWQKTPSPMVSEVLGLTDLDVVCLDAEHAPFDRGDLDRCVFALLASGKPCLVRIPTAEHHEILNALDLGATGILAPHILNGNQVEELVRVSLFGTNGRGYAGSTRAAGYGTTPMADHREASSKATTIIAQLEDAEALKSLDDILGIERLDAVFIGRVDLAVSLGCTSLNDKLVVEAVEAIVEKCRELNRRVGMFVADLGELPDWIDRGCSFFLLASDHAFLRAGASGLISTTKQTKEGGGP